MRSERFVVARFTARSAPQFPHRVTDTTTPQGAELDQRAGHGISRHPGMEPADLYRRLLAERPQRPLRAVTAERFRPAFYSWIEDEEDNQSDASYPSDESDDEDEELHVPDGPPRHQAFAALNETLPPDRRFRHLAVVTGAVEADVYCAPESDA